MSKPIELENLSEVVWIQTAFLGDIILTTAAGEALKKFAPNIRQCILTTPMGAQALKGQSVFEKVVSFDKKNASQLKAACDEAKRFVTSKDRAITIQPHKSLRSTYASWRIGLERITYEETAFSFWARHRVPRVTLLHESNRIKLLLEPLGISRQDSFSLSPKLTPEVAESMASKSYKELPPGKSYLAVVPGSQWETKRWPDALFGKLVEKILTETDHDVLLLGAPNETKHAEVIFSHVSKKHVSRLHDLVGKTKVAELAGVFKRCKAIVSNDSSPVHYGSSLDVPVVAIFGPTLPSMGFYPLSKRSVVVEQKDLPCRPCGLHGPRSCPLEHFNCMKSLEVEKVFRALRKVLE